MHHGGEQGEAHGPGASHRRQARRPGRHEAKQLHREGPGEQACCQPKCLGDQANDPNGGANRDQGPLDPAYQRWVIEVAPVQADRVIHVMRFVDRERQQPAKNEVNDQPEPEHGDQAAPECLALHDVASGASRFQEVHSLREAAV